MKKNLILPLIVSLLTAVSCSRETVSIYKGTEEAGVCTLSVRLPEAADGETKMTVANYGKTAWEAGDQITVFPATKYVSGGNGAKAYTFTLVSGAGTKYAEFSCSDFSGTPQVAVYPASYAASFQKVKTDRVEYRVPAVVAYEKDAPVPVMFAANITNGKTANFHTVASLFKFSFTNIPPDATSFTLKADKLVDKYGISGSFIMKYTNIGNNAPQINGSAGDSFTYTFPAGTTEATFYVPVSPGQRSSYHIYFSNASGEIIGSRRALNKGIAFVAYAENGPYTLNRGDFHVFPSYDVRKYIDEHAGQPQTAPDKEGMNVKGIVWDDTRNLGIPGVVVSDGRQVTTTDENGIYYLNSDFNNVRCVFPIIPSDYNLTFSASTKLFNCYKPVGPGQTNNCDFHLTPRSGDSDNYTMLFLGDPQRMSSRTHSVESWKWMTGKLNEYRQTVSGDLYQILLGDCVVNEIEVSGKADDFISDLATSKINTLCVIGNHDHVQSATTQFESTRYFNQYFGPHNYAVNIGQVHYIFLDDMRWADKSYKTGLTENAWSFLKADLQTVDVNTPIVICMHCPMTRKMGGSYPSENNAHYKDMIQALAGRDVSFWYGHNHFYSFWTYDQEKLDIHAPGVKSLESHTVGRCAGNWVCSGEVMRDGSPRGMVEMKVEGRKMTWRFVSVDENYSSEMNLLAPNVFKGEKYNGEPIAEDNTLYCNIYLWDSSWEKPSVYINGIKQGTMTHCMSADYTSVKDPLFLHFMPIWASRGIQGYRSETPMDYDNSHLFKYKISDSSVHSAEVRVKDRWGNNLKQSINW